jgi:hypothetical protein
MRRIRSRKTPLARVKLAGFSSVLLCLTLAGGGVGLARLGNSSDAENASNVVAAEPSDGDTITIGTSTPDPDYCDLHPFEPECGGGGGGGGGGGDGGDGGGGDGGGGGSTSTPTDGGGGGGGGGDQDAGELIETAYNKAKDLMDAHPNCELKVRGPSTFNAAGMLYTLKTNNHIIDATNSTNGDRVAEAYPIRSGSDGYIKLYAPWAILQSKAYPAGSITAEEHQALSILHELGHLTGSLGASEADVANWENDVVALCFRTN